MSAKFAGNFFVSLLGTWEVSASKGFLSVFTVDDYYLRFERQLSWKEVEGVAYTLKLSITEVL